MNFRPPLALTASVLSLLILSGVTAEAAAKKQLVLQYSVEEGMNGRVARGAVFKAWINEGRPVVAMTDDDGKVALEMGRPLAKGDTLFVEAESEDGNRYYSWVYKESPLTGTVEGACQLVGLDDFHQAPVITAQRGKLD